MSPLPQRLFAPPALLFADCDCVEIMHCIAILLEIRRGENPKPDDAISSDVSCYSYSLLLEPSMCPSDVKIMVLR